MHPVLKLLHNKHAQAQTIQTHRYNKRVAATINGKMSAQPKNQKGNHMNSKHLLCTALMLLACLLLMPAKAEAYLDPGAGSAILQGLIAAIAGLLVVGKLYWRQLIGFFKKKNRHGTDDGENNGNDS